jgi:hypothetical protein
VRRSTALFRYSSKFIVICGIINTDWPLPVIPETLHAHWSQDMAARHPVWQTEGRKPCPPVHTENNAASFLIGRALRYGRRMLGWGTVKAYSDERFNEAGVVYKAVGFRQCPPSRHRNRSRYALIWAGRVLSDRAIYRIFGSHAAARAAGAALIRVPARQAWSWRAHN